MTGKQRYISYTKYKLLRGVLGINTEFHSHCEKVFQLSHFKWFWWSFRENTCCSQNSNTSVRHWSKISIIQCAASASEANSGPINTHFIGSPLSSTVSILINNALNWHFAGGSMNKMPAGQVCDFPGSLPVVLRKPTVLFTIFQAPP